MSYIKKLQNPLWQKKRLEILQRDNFKCIQCECDNKELHVHHRWYVFGKEIWDYPDTCFETLCYECHEYVESQIKNSIHDINLEFRRSIISQDDYSCILRLLNNISVDSENSRYAPHQISDAIHYLTEHDVIASIIEMRAERFK
jgi:hypothetical protein